MLVLRRNCETGLCNQLRLCISTVHFPRDGSSPLDQAQLFFLPWACTLTGWVFSEQGLSALLPSPQPPEWKDSPPPHSAGPLQQLLPACPCRHNCSPPPLAGGSLQVLRVLTLWVWMNEMKTFRLDVVRGKALLKVLSGAVSVKMNVGLTCKRFIP